MTRKLQRALVRFTRVELRRAACPVCCSEGNEPCFARRAGLVFDAWPLQRRHPARVRLLTVGRGAP